jgi:DNA invertase Pin-like site-specific DNA recombinase
MNRQDIVRAVKVRSASLNSRRHRRGAGKCFLDMLGVFAEFETNLRRERQLEGIAKTKAAEVYRGRKPSIEPAQARELRAQGLGATEIAKARSASAERAYTVYWKPANKGLFR